MAKVTQRYQIVRVANGEFSVRSLEHHETFHPVIGPVAEAKALYVQQLRIPERIAASRDEFVIWDVGLGAAANPLTLLRAIADVPSRLRIISFDMTKEPLEFALGHCEELKFIKGFETPLETLLRENKTEFAMPGGPQINWELHLADFPTLLQTASIQKAEKPHAIFYDAFSVKKNSAMWSLPVFTQLSKLLDPSRPCAMATYSRSTILRTTLLLAGFYVGVGQPTGEKEETTIAGNALELIDEPLGRSWLFRARKSTSAEPLQDGVYEQRPLTPESWDRLQAHKQFALT